MFKIICIIAVLSCTTASFANESIVSTEPNSSQSEVTHLASDKTPEAGESSVKLPSGNEHSTLKRLQVGLFPNRVAVDNAVVRLRQLDFETWIIPFNDEYAVSIGAFSSQSNLERALKRLAAAGFTDNTQIIVVDNKTQHSQNIVPTQIARSTLFGGKVSQDEAYVPKKKYEKLEQEVKLLKSQMQFLMEGKTPSEQTSKSATPTTTQTKTESSETDALATSSEEPADPPNESDDSHAEKDETITEGDRQAEAEDAKRQMDMFLREQTVLFKRGELEFELGLNYSQDTAVATCFNADDSSAFCPKGSKPIPKLHTRSVDTSFDVTYGIADDLALSLSFPYSYNEQEVDSTSFDVEVPVRHSDQLGIGDVSGSLRYTAWHEKGSVPGTTLSVSAKSTTGDEKNQLGTGFWNVGAGLSLTKTFDPVVFFGSVGYTATIQDGGVNPGDQISYSFGGGFSLNDRVSVSTAFSGSTVLRSEVNGQEIPGSAQDISSLQFSSTIKISKALFVEPFVAFGLTRESGDYTVGLRVPYRFGEKFPLPFFHD